MTSDDLETLRLATTDDVAAIRSLTREAYAKWVPVIGREPMPMRADYDLAIRDHRFDLLFRGEALVALIETIQRDDHLFIENLAVRPACQGRGYGQRLLDHAERLATSLGLPEMRLVTNQAFVANVRFYERAGYRIEREEAFMGGTGLHFSKRI